MSSINDNIGELDKNYENSIINIDYTRSDSRILEGGKNLAPKLIHDSLNDLYNLLYSGQNVIYTSSSMQGDSKSISFSSDNFEELKVYVDDLKHKQNLYKFFDSRLDNFRDGIEESMNHINAITLDDIGFSESLDNLLVFLIPKYFMEQKSFNQLVDLYNYASLNFNPRGKRPNLVSENKFFKIQKELSKSLDELDLDSDAYMSLFDFMHKRLYGEFMYSYDAYIDVLEDLRKKFFDDFSKNSSKISDLDISTYSSLSDVEIELDVMSDLYTGLKNLKTVNDVPLLFNHYKFDIIQLGNMISNCEDVKVSISKLNDALVSYKKDFIEKRVAMYGEVDKRRMSNFLSSYKCLDSESLDSLAFVVSENNIIDVQSIFDFYGSHKHFKDNVLSEIDKGDFDKYKTFESILIKLSKANGSSAVIKNEIKSLVLNVDEYHDLKDAYDVALSVQEQERREIKPLLNQIIGFSNNFKSMSDELSSLKNELKDTEDDIKTRKSDLSEFKRVIDDYLDLDDDSSIFSKEYLLKLVNLMSN